jgi:nicotinamide riboside transporter PnuC
MKDYWHMTTQARAQLRFHEACLLAFVVPLVAAGFANSLFKDAWAFVITSIGQLLY